MCSCNVLDYFSELAIERMFAQTDGSQGHDPHMRVLDQMFSQERATRGKSTHLDHQPTWIISALGS